MVVKSPSGLAVSVSWTTGSASARERAIAAGVSPDEWILDLYREHGDSFPQTLTGGYALALWDGLGGRVILARDPMGLRPLYYALLDGELWFATSVAKLVSYLPGSSRPSHEWILRYVADTASIDRSWTPFEGVQELPRGHMLVLDRQGVRQEVFHRFRDDATWATQRDPGCVRRYRDTFLGVLDELAGSQTVLGAENSGGLDSGSVIAGLLNSEPEAPSLHTFGMPQFTGDETHMRTVASGEPVSLTVLSAPSETELLRRTEIATAALGHPPTSSTPVWYQGFAEIASQSGVNVIFSGHGGDHAATSRGYLAVREMIAHGQCRTAYSSLGGSRGGRLRALYRLWRQRGTHVPVIVNQVDGIRRLPIRAAWQHSLEQSLKQLPTSNIPDSGFKTVNEYILGFLLHEGPTTRALETSIVAAESGVDYVFPMLDPRLIQCYLSTPAIEKYGRGFDRYLHRRAVEDLLPSSIVWERPKNDGTVIPRTSTFTTAFRTDLPLRQTFPDGLAEPLAEIVDLDADSSAEQWTAHEEGSRRQLEAFRWNVMVAQRWLENLPN